MPIVPLFLPFSAKRIVVKLLRAGLESLASSSAILPIYLVPISVQI
jgi:hypothetical protein